VVLLLRLCALSSGVEVYCRSSTRNTVLVMGLGQVDLELLGGNERSLPGAILFRRHKYRI
jgi:hypothetical protein